MSETLRVMDGLVVAMDYSLHVDGELVDASESGDPLEYLHGYGNIIPGLERELTGLAAGESRQVVVVPQDGYGDNDDTAFMEVPRSEFPADIELEAGMELQVEGEGGNSMYARITEVGAEQVRLDFNHPLAGKELHFEVKVVSLRAATDEELEHGHPHTHGHHHS